MALKKDAASRQFIDNMSYETMRRAHLGSPENFKARPATELTKLHNFIAHNVSQLNALEHDRTRPSDAEKHFAAKTLAGKAVAEVQKTRAALARYAENQIAAGRSAAAEVLRAGPDHLMAEIRSYVRENSKDPEFIAGLRSAVEGDADLARAILGGPAFLSGLSGEMVEQLRIRAVAAHAPEAAAMIAEGVEVEGLDGKLSKVEAGIPSAYYSDATAAGVNTRVDLNAPAPAVEGGE